MSLDYTNLIGNCYLSIFGSQEERVDIITEWVHELRHIPSYISSQEIVEQVINNYNQQMDNRFPQKKSPDVICDLCKTNKLTEQEVRFGYVWCKKCTKSY